MPYKQQLLIQLNHRQLQRRVKARKAFMSKLHSTPARDDNVEALLVKKSSKDSPKNGIKIKRMHGFDSLLSCLLLSHNLGRSQTTQERINKICPQSKIA